MRHPSFPAWRRPLWLGLAGALVACRPDPGTPTYRNADDFLGQDDTPNEPIEGADPYEPGEARLALGAFYEGESSEQVIIDDVSTHFYIYGLEADGTPTFDLSPDSNFVEEGFQSDRVSHSGTPWWGGGIQWDDSRDLSNWTTLWVSFLSEDEAFADIEVHVLGGVEAIVQASDYGYLNDGTWHHLSIPLEDFEGVDLSQVTAPFVLIGNGGTEGERLYIDNVYYSQD